MLRNNYVKQADEMSVEMETGCFLLEAVNCVSLFLTSVAVSPFVSLTIAMNMLGYDMVQGAYE